jgi:RNA polymerase sigma-70 factor (ECF subfamily)
MDANDPASRLSRITTLWSMVHQAHGGSADGAEDAQAQFMERYGGAVHRYLLGALRDVEAADELFQEFALRFLRGDFKNANPQRGRFRDYLKTALFHLIGDYQRRNKARQQAPSLELGDQPAPAANLTESEQAFLECWRQQLMDRTWLALGDVESKTGQPYHTILRFRADHPSLSSAELAQQLGAHLGKAYSIDAVRQALHRAREKFTECLLQEVEQSLEQPSRQRLEEELTDLGLLAYCRAALDRGPKR